MCSRVRNDKNEAMKLRLTGRSYNEITQLLGVPKSTLSGWFTGLTLSEKAQERIQKRVFSKSVQALVKRNKNQTHLAIQRMRDIRKESRQEIGDVNKEELKLIGMALYWAEGHKRLQIRHGRELTSHAVSLTNSDPALVAMFLKFLREVCNVSDDQITAGVRIYQHMNDQSVIAFWQQLTKIPGENFGKVYYGVSKSSKNKRPFNRLPYGTIQIRVNNTKLFHKIMGWIEGLSGHA